MRILALTPLIPWPPNDGGRIRMHALLTGLAGRHEVAAISLAAEESESIPAAVEALRSAGVRLETVPHSVSPVHTAGRALWHGRSMHFERFRSPLLRNRADEITTTWAADVLLVEYSVMSSNLPSRRCAPVVLDQHNVEYALPERLAATSVGLAGLAYRVYAAFEGPRRRQEELRVCTRADAIACVSEADRDLLRRDLPASRIAVVPNGVDTDYFDAPVSTGTGGGAVFVGKLDYRPNADACLWFVKEILPRIRAVLPSFPVVFAGRDPAPAVRALASEPHVRVTGTVDDVRPFLSNAAVAVVPLRAGTGTRLKILEALAMRKPVVSTRIGCEGLELRDGVHFRLADEPEEFAKAVIDLARDPVVAGRLGSNGRDLVEARYAWSRQVARLEALLREVADRANTGSGIQVRHA